MSYGADVAVGSEINTKLLYIYKHSVGRKYNYWTINMMVHDVTSRL